MRSVPLGLIPDVACLRSAAHAQASITHDTIEGVLSSEVVALMAHALLYEQSTLRNLPLRIEQATGFVLSNVWSRDVECDAIQTLHAVATALLRNKRMSELLVDCVNFGGNVDSVAAIALGLASLSKEYENDIPANLSIDLEFGPYGQTFLRNMDLALVERFPALRLLAQ
jgi:ADP-ribosylglycohydrolase